MGRLGKEYKYQPICHSHFQVISRTACPLFPMLCFPVPLEPLLTFIYVVCAFLRHQPAPPPTHLIPSSTLPGKVRGPAWDSLVDTEQLGVRQCEAWEDGRRPKGRRCLPPALCTVAYVQRKRLLEGRLKGYGTALTAGIHGGRMCCGCVDNLYLVSYVPSNWPVLVQGWQDKQQEQQGSMTRIAT